MEPLATVDDVAADYPGGIPEDDRGRVETLLKRASAVVRSYTGQSFTKETTTERIRPRGDKVILPKRPVVSVESVGVFDGTNVLPIVGYMWDGGCEIWLCPGETVINLAADVLDLFRYNTPLVEVAYTHGYDMVPEDIVTVVCGMVARTYASPGVAGTYKSQTVGPFSATLSDAAAQGIAGLTDADRLILNRYRRSTGTVELR